jgi:hypothetical protein
MSQRRRITTAHAPDVIDLHPCAVAPDGTVTFGSAGASLGHHIGLGIGWLVCERPQESLAV